MSTPLQPSATGGGPLDPGQAAGSQAQFNQLLQLLRVIAGVLTGNAQASPFVVYPVVTNGNVNLATLLPNGTRSGTFVIRQATPGANTFTLPAGGGPYTVTDGAGNAAAHNITIAAPAGYTIGGATTITTNWGSLTFVLDGTNYIAQP